MKWRKPREPEPEYWVLVFTAMSPRQALGLPDEDPERIRVGLFNDEAEAEYWKEFLFGDRDDITIKPGDFADMSLTEAHRYLVRNEGP